MLFDFDGRPITSIVKASLCARVLVVSALLVIGKTLPSFDSSSATLLELNQAPAYLEALVRWDTVHFVSIAQHEYQYEQQTAFMPALPFIMRLGARSLEGMIWTGVLASALASALALVCMYKLGLELGLGHRMAMRSTQLLLLAPSPATFHAVPYTEPFAACLTFAGMLAWARGRQDREHGENGQPWIAMPLAALLWAAASIFRAQACVLGIGFFGWELLLRRPYSSGGRFDGLILGQGVQQFVCLSLISLAPFVMFQAWVHQQFCAPGAAQPTRPWCHTGLGSSYGWVQSEYWNVGPFRYWTLQQVPNFVLSSPVIVMSMYASWTYYSHNTKQHIYATLPFLSSAINTEAKASTTSPTEPDSRHDRKKARAVTLKFPRPFLSPSLLPFIHLHTALTLLLLVSAHVQIVLRVCVTNPVLFWFIAANPNERIQRRWIMYCVTWGAVSIVLWACFLPPA